MLKRTAESLYWMARNLERADGTARLLEVELRHRLEVDEELSEEAQWRALLDIVDAQAPYLGRYPDGRVGVQRVVQFLGQDQTNPNSLYNCVRLARENARVARGHMPSAVWQTINQLWLALAHHPRDPLQPRRAAALFAQIQREVALVQGLAQGTMMRGEAHAFTVLGQLQERADLSARILAVRCHRPRLDEDQATALLESLAAVEAGRQRYQGVIRPLEVVALTVLDPALPRSLIYCLDGLGRALGRLAPAPDGASAARLAALRAQLREGQAQDILTQGLDDYLERFLDGLADLTEALHADYFLASPDEIDQGETNQAEVDTPAARIGID